LQTGKWRKLRLRRHGLRVLLRVHLGLVHLVGHHAHWDLLVFDADCVDPAATEVELALDGMLDVQLDADAIAVAVLHL